MTEIKDMIAFYRKRANLSQRELADKLGISPSSVGMYESGKRFPEREIEEALADLFNVSLNELRGLDYEIPEYDPVITELEFLLPKLTPEQKVHILQTARLFAETNSHE